MATERGCLERPDVLFGFPRDIDALPMTAEAMAGRASLGTAMTWTLTPMTSPR